MEHRFSCEQPTDLNPIETARESIGVPGFNAVHIAQMMECGVGPADVVVDPAMFSIGITAGHQYLVEGTIGGEVESLV